MSRACVGALCLAICLQGTPYIRASDPVFQPALTKEAQAIATAAAVQEPMQRESAIRDAIRNGLNNSGSDGANAVLAYLGESGRWIDPRSYEDVLVEYQRTAPAPYMIDWLLDEADLRAASRGSRLDTYRGAIERGEVKLKRGRVISRAAAMDLASRDGMIELLPLLHQYESEGPQGLRDSVIPMVKLTAGASDREEGLTRAASQLASLSDADLQREAKGVGFRRAVLIVAREVCTPSPIDGSRNAGCGPLGARFGSRGQSAEKREVVVPGAGQEDLEFGEWFNSVARMSDAKAASNPP